MVSNDKKKCENILFITFLIVNMSALAFASCTMRLTDDISLRPSVALKIGSHEVELTLDKNKNDITFFDKQTIVATCATKFENHLFDARQKLTLECVGNDLHTHDRVYYSRDLSLECSPQKWNLYELFPRLAWCSSNTTSYLLARPKDEEATTFEYLAGICYDIQMLSFKTLYFTIAPKHSKDLYPKALDNYNIPNLELKHLKETFGKKNVVADDYDDADFKDWIMYSQYNYSSIIQNSLLLNEFNDQLGSLLDLVWWPNLRLGNWKRYERALARQVESQQQSYDIMAGVSAVATVPIVESCQTNYTLKKLVNNKNNKVPMYVWNYLRSPHNSSDEVVIIGFNSPFYEFYPEKDVVFCHDICQEISWLKKASSTFRYSALGVIFCCTSDEVKLAKRLDGFPETDINLRPQDDVTVRPPHFF